VLPIEASLLVEWANEYGLSYHGIETHFGGNTFKGIEHIKIKNYHIRIK
jgi:hypothetical protein